MTFLVLQIIYSYKKNDHEPISRRYKLLSSTIGTSFIRYEVYHVIYNTPCIDIGTHNQMLCWKGDDRVFAY